MGFTNYTQSGNFGLVYGSQPVAPTEIVVTSHRVKHFDESINDEKRRLELDLINDKI